MAVQITEGVYWLGVQDPDLRYFDIVMKTDSGTTYNAYLVKGENGAALIDAVKEPFFEEYLSSLREVTDLEQVKYLVINHTEPDHSGAVQKLLEVMPHLTIVASGTALEFLKEVCRRPFNCQPIVKGYKIELGGKTLSFLSALLLHWPDNIFTYLQEDKILFSGDCFGSHFTGPHLFNDEIEAELFPAFKYYYDGIMSPFKKYVIKALNRLERVDIGMICPGHGLILRQNPHDYMNHYRQWSEPVQPSTQIKVVIAYASAYGYTKMLGEHIEAGMLENGGIEVKWFDLIYSTPEEVMAELEGARGLLIGTPTLNKDAVLPVWQLLAHLSPVTHGGMIAAAFGSYGWSGEGVPHVESRLRMLRMKLMPGIRARLKPAPEQLEAAQAWGRDFAAALKGDESRLQTGLSYQIEINPHYGKDNPAAEYPRIYQNEDIIVYWNPELCTHDTNCFDTLGTVFNPARRPWVDINGDSPLNIIKTIDRCPSGALKYGLPEGSRVSGAIACGPGFIHKKTGS